MLSSLNTPLRSGMCLVLVGYSIKFSSTLELPKNMTTEK